MKHKTSLMAALVSVGLAVMSPVAHTKDNLNANDHSAIKIGVIFPLTGPSADTGNSARVGVEIAVREINEVRSFFNRPIEIIVKDDEGKPDMGELQTRELLAQGVVAVIGFCNTGVAMKSLPLFQEKKIPLLISCATGTSLTEKYPNKDSFIFRIAPTTKILAQAIIDDIVKQGKSQIAVLADSSPYGDVGLKDMGEYAQSKGIKFKAIERFNVGTDTVAEQIAKLKASRADVVIGWTVPADQGTISKAISASRWNVLRYGDWSLSSESAKIAAGASIDGGRMPQSVVHHEFIRRNNDFYVDYKRQLGGQSEGSFMASAQSYDAMNILVRALVEAKGDFSGPSIKNALESFDRTHFGVVAVYEKPFSQSDHDAISRNMLWMSKWQSGQRMFAYKEDETRSLTSQKKFLRVNAITPILASETQINVLKKVDVVKQP